jgi:uncharacterized membrane protein YphA (DoxX/SURF4 family)
MNVITIFRLSLAAVFVLAGVTKLRRPASTRQDLGEWGLPTWAIPGASVGLPAIELAVAAMLLIEPFAAVGAACAFGLLVLFSSLIGINLWRGHRPACACFGTLTRARIGPGTLARNVVFLAVACALLIPPQDLPVAFSAPYVPSALTIALIAMASVIAFQAWWGLQMWRQHGRLIVRIEQLEGRSRTAARQLAPAPDPTPLSRPPDLAGQPAPALTLRDVAGRHIDLRSLRGKPTVLMFLDSACQHCRPLLSRLRTWHPAAHAIVVMAGQQPAELELAPDIILVADDAPIAMQEFGVLGTPTAIAIDAEGIVAEPAARGKAAVSRLLDRLARQEERYELATI